MTKKKKGRISMSKRHTGTLLAGIGLGLGLGLLFAPQSGEKTRKDLKKKMDDFVVYLKDLDYNEVKDNLVEKVENLKSELEDLNKEKVLEIAKVKAEDIKNKAEELYQAALRQGKPMVEKAAKEIKEKTVVVLKSMIAKLEEEDTSNKKPAPVKRQSKKTTK